MPLAPPLPSYDLGRRICKDCRTAYVKAPKRAKESCDISIGTTKKKRIMAVKAAANVGPSAPTFACKVSATLVNTEETFLLETEYMALNKFLGTAR
jgi:hypothetical protein